jgi:hypothetical protein
MVRFHKKETKGAGANGSTVNDCWVDISFHGQKAGYIYKSKGETFYVSSVHFDGVDKENKFTSLKGAKDFARQMLNS